MAVGAFTGEVVGVTIGTMGTILEDSQKFFKKLGIEDEHNSLQMMAMSSSVYLLN